MEEKKKCYGEVAYALGIITLAIGTALMERADFGMSMVVAPAYILHLKISQTLPFFSFGMAEYVVQALLLIVLCLVIRRFRLGYIMPFLTAFIYGLVLDFSVYLVSFIPGSGLVWRLAVYSVGMILCTTGVAFFFRTHLAPMVYELFVKEIARIFKKNIGVVKTVYDCISCLIAICLSFAFFGFGHFVGVKFGTIFCALVNGWLINSIGKILDKRFTFVRGIK